jgi:single-strand DNA-binding protein
MASVNKVMILGNLGADPQINMTQSGKKIASFSVGTSESWIDKNTKEKKQSTEWHKVAIYNNNLADIAGRYLKKGSKVYIEGELKTKKYTDKNGIEKYATEIVLSAFKGNLVILSSNENTENQKQNSAEPEPNFGSYDDEIPF